MTTRPTKAQNITILAGTIFVLFAGVYTAAFYFVKKEVEQTSLILQQAAQGETRRANLQALKKTLDETADKRADLEALFLVPDNVIDFIGNIESWGVSLGVKTILSGLREEDGRVLSFSVQAEGTFSELMNFMELLENLPYDAHLDDANLVNQGSGESKEVVWKGTFAVRVTSYIAPTEE